MPNVSASSTSTFNHSHVKLLLFTSTELISGNVSFICPNPSIVVNSLLLKFKCQSELNGFSIDRILRSDNLFSDTSRNLTLNLTLLSCNVLRLLSLSTVSPVSAILYSIHAIPASVRIDVNSNLPTDYHSTVSQAFVWNLRTRCLCA